MIFTLNNIVANPNFNKIVESDYQNYSFERFTDTLEVYEESSSVVDICKGGIAEGILSVEFHGREHLNVNRWMEALRRGDKLLREAVREGHITHSGNYSPSGRRDYLDAFGRAYRTQIETEESIISSGLEIFKHVWGFQPTSFIAPCYTWHSDIEAHLFNSGIKYLQGNRVQRVPHSNGSLEVEKTYNWKGKKHKSGLISVTRSFDFEPVTAQNKSLYLKKKTLELDRYMQSKMPVIISSHRVNYIGRICEKNRDENLELLSEFLKQLIRNHPDVVFMSTEMLASEYLKRAVH